MGSDLPAVNVVDNHVSEAQVGLIPDGSPATETPRGPVENLKQAGLVCGLLALLALSWLAFAAVVMR